MGVAPRFLSANHSSMHEERNKSVQYSWSTCPSWIALSLLLIRCRNHISEEVVGVSNDDTDNPAPWNSTHENLFPRILSRREELDEQKSIRKERGLQRNHVKAHPKEGIPACPVVKDHELQRDADKHVGRNTERPNERPHHA